MKYKSDEEEIKDTFFATSLSTLFNNVKVETSQMDYGHIESSKGDPFIGGLITEEAAKDAAVKINKLFVDKGVEGVKADATFRFRGGYEIGFKIRDLNLDKWPDTSHKLKSISTEVSGIIQEALTHRYQRPPREPEYIGVVGVFKRAFDSIF